MYMRIFYVILIATLIASCSSVPLEATTVPTTVPVNTNTTSPSASLRPSPTATEMHTETIKCEEPERTSRGVLFNEGMVFTYFGTMGENNQSIGMSLTYLGPNVEGRFFYLKKYQDKSDELKVMGCVENDRDLTLNIYKNDDLLLAVIHGQFLETDPNSSYEGDQLIGAVITGTWEDMLTTHNSSIYLQYDHSNRGTLDHQYGLAGAKDDQVIDEAAQKLLSAVANDDKQFVAQMMTYPLATVIFGERNVVRNQDEFLLNYERIFTKELKVILANARPHHLEAAWGGIMLGSNNIWLNADGKVFAINNNGG